MKKIILSISLFVSMIALNAQKAYEILPDNNGTKYLKGIISREILEKDSAFSKIMFGKPPGYTPDTKALAMFQKNADSVNLIVFMGTWCEDSHYIIPRLYFLLDAAGVSRERVSLIATDRDKKTQGRLSESLNVTNVPTIIVLKKGKELGRVVEYGKSGTFDKDLGEIFSQAF